MLNDLPPQTEMLAPAPEKKPTNETTLDWDGLANPFDLQEQTVAVSEEPSASAEENAPKPREDNRTVIPLVKSAQTFSRSRISNVSYTGGLASSANYEHRDTTKTILSASTAEKTITAYAARMKLIANNAPSDIDLGNFVTLHNYYTNGVVAINPDGTKAFSQLGNKEQIQALKDKAKEKALKLLDGTERLTLLDVKNMDAFAAILPEKEREDFMRCKEAIAKNAKSMFAEPEKKAKEPGKFKKWFKNLFHKKEKAALVSAVEAPVAKQANMAKQPAVAAKPQSETFSFDAEHPMESIQKWCEQTPRLNHDQYEKAKAKLPAEYRDVAAHMSNWYRNTKYKKDFAWDKLSPRIQQEFVAANQQYKDNQTAKAAAKEQEKKSTPRTWTDLKNKQAHMRYLRDQGLSRR